MNEQKKRIAVSVLLGLLIVTLMSFSLTAARYSAEKESDSRYDGELVYTVSDNVVITTVDEFFNAIENGYTNIQISDDIDNPLIITGSPPDVNSDLTIDLNGNELQRNDREPVLNVTEGVRLTIIDSKGGGGFYNPVGSVFNVDGGTITVAAGLFESGPRNGEKLSGGSAQHASEYASPSGNSWTTPAGASISQSGSFTVYDGTGSGNTYVPSPTAVSMPVIVPAVTDSGTTADGETYVTVNGNMYFDEGSNPSFGGTYVVSDTYLYFTIDDNNNITNNAYANTGTSADFYYSYYMTFNGNVGEHGAYEYAGPAEPAEGNFARVTVYGYNGVKATSVEVANSDPFSAIRLQGGNLYARGGDYVSYFGEEDTFSVYATGGFMSISQGSTFEAHGRGVCIDLSYADAISHGLQEDADLYVSGGRFYSQGGDIVHLTNGFMQVNGGSFTKNAADESASDNGAAIHIEGGRLNVQGASADPEGAISFSLSGSNVTGVRSASGGSTAGGAAAGTVTLSNVNFTFNGGVGGGSGYSNNYGLNVAGGTVETENCSVYLADSNSFGIYTNGGVVSCSGMTTINVLGATSSGILAYGGSVTISGKYTSTVGIGGTNTLSSTAISSEGGSVTLNGMSTITTDGLGITSRGSGTITVNGTLDLTSNHGTAIYMSGGSLTTAANSTVDIISTISDEYSWVTGSTVSNIYNGVYIQGGSLTANGTFNVTHTGVANDTSYQHYDDLVVRSYAVRVEGTTSTTVALTKGTIKNTVGGGVYVSGTENVNVYLGGWMLNGEGQWERTDSVEMAVITEGKGTSEGYYAHNTGNQTSSEDAWNFKKNESGGHAIEIVGGTVHINGGDYSAAMGNGILVSNGTAYIYDGDFVGADSYEANTDGDLAGAAASYGFKMYGGKAYITGGTFGNTGQSGSGAFITASSSNSATAEISNATFDVGGTTGFSVHRNATVTFKGNSNTVRGVSTGLAIEDVSYGAGDGSQTGSSVTIEGGTFAGTNSTGENDNTNGIYYGEGSSSLTITGGTFTGATRSGLYIAVNPGSNIRLSGGTFTGNDYQITDTYRNSLFGSSRTYYGNGGAISTPVGRSYNWRGYYEFSGLAVRFTSILNGAHAYVDGDSGRQVDEGTGDGYIANTVSQHRSVTIW